MQQVGLEGGDIAREVTKWSPAIRHSGAYVTPQFYGWHFTARTPGVLPSHDFGLRTFGEDTPDWRPEDGDEVTLHQAHHQPDLELPHESDELDDEMNLDPATTVNYIARAMVARPLTHLTIRM